jgi:hypothetical protein
MTLAVKSSAASVIIDIVVLHGYAGIMTYDDEKDHDKKTRISKYRGHQFDLPRLSKETQKLRPDQMV